MSSQRVACPKCKSSAILRLTRTGFWQEKVLPFFGRYPWECKICRLKFSLKKRGTGASRRSRRVSEQEAHPVEARGFCTHSNRSQHRPMGVRRRCRRTRAVLVLLGFGFLLAPFAFGLLAATEASRAGKDAESALRRAEAQLRQHKFVEARRDFSVARQQFRRATDHIGRIGWLIHPVARATPLLGVQVRGAETLAAIGESLSRAGERLSEAAALVTDERDKDATPSDALAALRMLGSTLADCLATLATADSRLTSLRPDRLYGPLSSPYRQLLQRLPGVRAQVASAKQGIEGVVTFLGGDGPRRYLLFSQNPDEIRPTGGFLGTYGVLSASQGQLTLERYEDLDEWRRSHPGAVVPAEIAPRPFRLPSPPVPQTISNANAMVDWSTAGQLASRLWQEGGEEAIDGVLSVIPEFLVRLLSVLGPVQVSLYDEVVTADNLLDRFDFYTDQQMIKPSFLRKDFVAALVQRVMRLLMNAPPSQWEPLARVIRKAFDAREAMAWSRDAQVADVLSARGWDGNLPRTTGDFFYNAEFEYAAKNGRGLRRSFDHEVALRPDGSGRVTTTIVIANTEEPSPFNLDSQSYITLYGPQGAILDAVSDEPRFSEDSVAGHPAAAWLRSVMPLDQTTLRVVWEVPRIVLRRPDGRWEYRLWWMHIPGNSGDTLRLHVNLPSGWHWSEQPPPTSYELRQDLKGMWVLSRD